jgi:ribosomal protein S18 acetylase RimI-like enzyme
MVIKIIRIQDASFAVPMYSMSRRAFANNGLHEALFPPRLHDPTNPDERHQFGIDALRKRLVTKGAWSIAAVDDAISDDHGVVKVLGYASWYEPKIPAVGLNDAQPDTEDDGWVDDGEGGLRGDGVKKPRSLDFEVHQQLQSMLNDSKVTVLGEPARPAWCMFHSLKSLTLQNYKRLTCEDLGSLAVDPAFAGRGIATQLVQWGIDRAEDDNLPAFLEATQAAVSLYKRLGFKVMKDLPPLENGYFLTIMARDPQARQ